MSEGLSSLVKESKARRAKLVAENEVLRKEASESVAAAVDASLDALNAGVATVWQNQQQLETEARALQAHASRFSKQTAKWVSTLDNFTASAKALGDVQNWARAIEADMAFVNTAIEQLQHAREQEVASSAPVDFRFQIDPDARGTPGSGVEAPTPERASGSDERADVPPPPPQEAGSGGAGGADGRSS